MDITTLSRAIAAVAFISMPLPASAEGNLVPVDVVKVISPDHHPYFNVLPADLIGRIIDSLDAQMALVPIPRLKCGRPAFLKYCNGNVNEDVLFSVTETASGGDIDAFHREGAPGYIYEVSARVSGRAAPISFVMFESLCVAMVSAMRTGGDNNEAYDLYINAFTRAGTRSGSGDGVWVDRDNPSILVVEVRSVNETTVTCRMASQWSD